MTNVIPLTNNGVDFFLIVIYFYLFSCNKTLLTFFTFSKVTRICIEFWPIEFYSDWSCDKLKLSFIPCRHRVRFQRRLQSRTHS